MEDILENFSSEIRVSVENEDNAWDNDGDNSEIQEESENGDDQNEQKPPIIRKHKGWSIFRVPSHVRQVDERAYTPKIISIGPFHYKEAGLEFMEAQKLRFLGRLLTRMRDQNSQVSLETAVEELEGKARKCYSEEFEEISSDDFVRMMVLDGCFIVELLRLYGEYMHPLTKKETSQSEAEAGKEQEVEAGKEQEVELGEEQAVDEPIFATRWMLPNLARDLLMLENQIPMFVLHTIYNLTNSDSKPTPLNELALRFFDTVRPGRDRVEDFNYEAEYEHLLALFQSSFVPSNSHSSRQRRRTQVNYQTIPGLGWVHNAKILTFAGIRFRQRSGRLLDISFKGNVLAIPTLFIYDGTGPVLRNLIAYEQCNVDTAPYFTCLAVFFDSVVNTEEDVKILRDAGIIKQAQGGDEEVVTLFNSLTKEVEFDINECYIAKQIGSINKFCQSKSAKLRLRFRLGLAQFDFMKIILSYISFAQTLIYLFPLLNENQGQTGTIASAAPAPS